MDINISCTKKFLLTVYIALQPFISFSQNCLINNSNEISNEMKTFMNACIIANKGYQYKNTENIQDAIDSLMTLKIERMRENMYSETDSGQAIPTTGHLVYDPVSLDSILVCDFSFDPIKINPPELLRGESPHIFYINKALRAKGYASFEFIGSGCMELSAVSEFFSDISVTIENENDNTVYGTGIYGKGISYAKWNLSKFSKFKVTIYNLSEKDISFVIAIK